MNLRRILASAGCFLIFTALPAWGANVFTQKPGGLKPLLYNVKTELSNFDVGHHHRRVMSDEGLEEREDNLAGQSGEGFEELEDNLADQSEEHLESALPEGVRPVRKEDVLIRRESFIRGQEILNAGAGTHPAHHRHRRRRSGEIPNPMKMLGDVAKGTVGQELMGKMGASNLPPPQPAITYENGHAFDSFPGDANHEAADGELISSHCYANCAQCFRHKTVSYMGVVCCDMCTNEQGVMRDKYHPWNEHLAQPTAPWDHNQCFQMPEGTYTKYDESEFESWMCPVVLGYYHPNSQMQMAHEGYSAADPAVQQMLSSVDLDPFQSSVDGDAERIGQSQAAAAA